MNFTKITADAFNELQKDAGVVFKNFNPASPEPADTDIIATTTGGVSVNNTPTFVDDGEDIDNCPNNTKELKRKTDSVKRALGGATVEEETGYKKITPKDLGYADNEDFTTIAWGGNLSNGGAVVAVLKDALSVDGITITSSKDAKGTLGVTFTGHRSIANPTKDPLEIYLYEPEEDETPEPEEDETPEPEEDVTEE